MLHRVSAAFAVLATASALRKHAQPPREDSDVDTTLGLSQARKSASELEFDAGLRLLDQLLEDNDLKQTLLTQMMEVPVALVQNMNGVPFDSSETLPRRPKVCAVVSNSHSVLAAEAGAKIDSVDGPVMRFNLSPTKRFERWVGGRTDIRVINDMIPCNWAKRGYPAESERLTFLLNTFGIQVTSKCLWPLRASTHHLYSLDYLPMNEGLYNLMETVRSSMNITEAGPNSTGAAGPNSSMALTKTPRKKKPWATTGMVGLTMLLSLCQEVRHYGFLPVFENSSADDCQQHYWQATEKCTSDGHHALTAEHALWAAISTRGELPGEGVIPGRARLQGSPFVNVTKTLKKPSQKTVVPKKAPPPKSEQEPPAKSKRQRKKQQEQEPSQESDQQPERETPESEQQPEQEPPAKSRRKRKKQQKQEPSQESDQQPERQPQEQED